MPRPSRHSDDDLLLSVLLVLDQVALPSAEMDAEGVVLVDDVVMVVVVRLTMVVVIAGGVVFHGGDTAAWTVDTGSDF